MAIIFIHLPLHTRCRSQQSLAFFIIHFLLVLQRSLSLKEYRIPWKLALVLLFSSSLAVIPKLHGSWPSRCHDPAASLITYSKGLKISIIKRGPLHLGTRVSASFHAVWPVRSSKGDLFSIPPLMEGVGMVLQSLSVQGGFWWTGVYWKVCCFIFCDSQGVFITVILKCCKLTWVHLPGDKWGYKSIKQTKQNKTKEHCICCGRLFPRCIASHRRSWGVDCKSSLCYFHRDTVLLLHTAQCRVYCWHSIHAKG